LWHLGSPRRQERPAASRTGGRRQRRRDADRLDASPTATAHVGVAPIGEENPEVPVRETLPHPLVPVQGFTWNLTIREPCHGECYREGMAEANMESCGLIWLVILIGIPAAAWLLVDWL